MKKKVLLTGATGSVGSDTLKELLKRQEIYETIVLEINTRKTKKELSSYKNQIKIIYGDLRDPSTFKNIQDIDFVIHLAAIIPPLADKKPDLAHQVNVLGTKNLIDAVKNTSKVPFFLYTSSISIYGDRIKEPWIKVSDPLLPNEYDFYTGTKIEAEKLVQDSNLRWSIFRLTAIMGPKSKIDPLLFHMPLNTCIEIATSRDTGFALINALEHTREIEGKIFNLSGGEKCRTSYQKFIENTFNICGLGKPDFPDTAFAEKNFHCAFYEDNQELEKILHFQRDSLEDFYNIFKSSIKGIHKLFTFLFKKFIKKYLLKKSEPHHAHIKKNKKQLERFFHKKENE